MQGNASSKNKQGHYRNQEHKNLRAETWINNVENG